MHRRRFSLALRITLLYIVPSILWILLSDMLLDVFFASNPQMHTYIEISKGWFFVVTTALVLYIALKHILGQLETANHHLETHAEQQEAISTLRQRALAGSDTATLLHEAVSLVALTLDVAYCSFLELAPDGQTLTLRAGVGWPEGQVGSATFAMSAETLHAYAEQWPAPIVLENGPPAPGWLPHLQPGDAPIQSSMSIAIVGSEQPVGLLAAHTAQQRRFSSAEQRFLSAIATVLANALQREHTEAELRRQKTLLECQSEASIDGILMVDPDDIIVLYNQRFAEMWGIPPATLQSRSADTALQTVLHQVQEPQQFAARIRHLYEHPTETSRDEIALQDGRLLDRYSTPIYDSGGHYYGRVWFYRDVTEIRHAQEAYRILVEHSLQGLIIMQEGRIVFANPAMSAINGYTIAEMRTMASAALNATLHPDDRAMVTHYLADRMAGKPVPSQYVFRMIRKDGTVRWLETSAVRTHYRGRAAIQASYIDVTERKQAEQQLYRANRALKTITACNQILIHATDERNLLQEVCRVVVEVGEYKQAWVGFAEDAPTKRIVPIAYAGGDPAFLENLHITWDSSEYGRGPTGTAVRTGQPCITHNPHNDPDYAPWRSYAIEYGYAASIALPLLLEPAVEPEDTTSPLRPRAGGALNIYAADTNTFDGEEVELLKELAADVSYGVLALRTHSQVRRTQNALHESEERFRTLVESMDDIIFTLDEQQRHTGVFGRWIERYGLSPDMFLGKTSRQINPDTADLHEAANLRALSGEDVVYDWSIDGEQGTYIQTSLSPIRSSQGTVIGVVGVGRDITAIKQSETALRASNDLLQTVLSSLNEAVLLVNPYTRQIQDCNRMTETIFGYRREELINHDTVHLHVNYAMFKQFGTRALAAYEAEGFFATEYQMRRKSGEVFPTEHFARPIYNAEHQLQNVVNVVRDITERKRAEEELKRSNQELTALNMVIAAINRFLKLSDIISTLHMLLADHLHIDAGAILLYHEEDDCLALESAWGLPDALVHNLSHTPMHLTHNAHIVYEQVPIIVSDMRSDAVLMRVIPPDPPDAPAEGHQWVYLGIPLLAQGKTQGVVNLFKHEQSTTPTSEFAFFVTLGQQVGSAMQNARLFAEVVEGREHLQHLSHQLVKVQEAERYAIARELHDEVGQILTGLNLTLEMVARLPVEEVYPRLEEAHTMVNDLMLRVREMSLQLRPPMLDDLGLLAALLWHVERYTSQTGIVVHFRQAGLERRFAAEVEIAIYRMVQEALTNVARYAGTSDVVVRLWANDAMLGVQIEDQGNGFDPEEVLSRHTTSGLSGMRERLRLLGGELEIDAAPGRGCCLAVEIPLQREPVV